MNIKPKISVIVPVYNAEKYLCKCIESILSQTFTNFELLLINDGSKDRSGEICEEFARKDGRIKVFHQSNGGVSSARNKGLDNFCGEYICFIDSDDWIEPEYLGSFFVHALQKNESAFIVQDIYQESAEKTEILFNFPCKTFYENEFYVLFYRVKLFCFGGPFAKLYNSDIINNHSIRFSENINYGEDLLFMLEYFQYVKIVCVLSKAFYHYTWNNLNSLSRSYSSFESEFYCFREIKKACDILSTCFEMDKDAINHIHVRIGSFLMRSIQTLYLPIYKKKHSERISILRKINTKENIGYINNYQKNQKNKLQIIPVFLFRHHLISLFDLYHILKLSTRYVYTLLLSRYQKLKNNGRMNNCDL